jgi:hypothetical protein
MRIVIHAKRPHHWLAAAVLFAGAAPLAAQTPTQQLPAVALRPEPLGAGMIPPVAYAPSSPKTDGSLEPAGFFPTQMSKPNAAPPPPVNPPATAQQRTTSYSAPGQPWRWHGYGTVNAQLAGRPAAITSTTVPPLGAAPANIGAPRLNSPEPSWGNPPVQQQPALAVEGPTMPPQAPPTAPAVAPSTDLRLNSPPLPRAVPPQTIEPWNGVPSAMTPDLWRPAVVRASSQQ